MFQSLDCWSGCWSGLALWAHRQGTAASTEKSRAENVDRTSFNGQSRLQTATTVYCIQRTPKTLPPPPIPSPPTLSVPPSLPRSRAQRQQRGTAASSQLRVSLSLSHAPCHATAAIPSLLRFSVSVSVFLSRSRGPTLLARDGQEKLEFWWQFLFRVQPV